MIEGGKERNERGGVGNRGRGEAEARDDKGKEWEVICESCGFVWKWNDMGRKKHLEDLTKLINIEGSFVVCLGDGYYKGDLGKTLKEKEKTGLV